MIDQPVVPETPPVAAVQPTPPAGAPPVASPSAPPVQSKQIGKYKVDVVRDKCIGAASCVAIAPKVFQLDEKAIAIILSQDGESDDTKLLAAQSCPTAAVIVTDTTTGEQVWPK